MRFGKSLLLIIAAAGALVAGMIFLSGCEEDVADITPPQVQYNDQTFALLVNDGNGTGKTAENAWDHDGVAVCTLDWNNDGSGPNRVPVNYVYDHYPTVDGRVTKDRTVTNELIRGDLDIWNGTPWTTLKTSPLYGHGSGVKEVKVKALYTYVNPPRIWFLFQWEDPSHSMVGDAVKGLPSGVMGYHWQNRPGFDPPADGFNSNHDFNSREDWLALVWSTWWAYNTNNKGKDKAAHKTADMTGYAWKFVETVPGFQQQGLTVCKGAGDIMYKTPAVSTSDKNSPYYDKFYPGPYCDMWFFGMTRSNYTSLGGWEQGEASYMFDTFFTTAGFNKPEVASNTNGHSLDENLNFDSGVGGYTTNGSVFAYPANQAPDDPGYNPPGAPYIWNTELTAPPFSLTLPGWSTSARISAYKNRPALGSCADLLARASWSDPTDNADNNVLQPKGIHYFPWDTPTPVPNEYAKDWCYTLEIEREIGTWAKTDPTEDVLLGIFNSHPGE